MKRKGITIWEQYLERFVLGAALLFFLGFTAWQFMSQPNSEKIGKKTVTPGQIDDLLKDQAVALQTRLAPEAPAAFEIPDHDSVHDEFVTALAASISPAERLVASAPSVDLGYGVLAAGTEVVYVEPTLPAPYSLRVGQTFDAIDENYVAGSEVLSAQFAEAPHDLTWITAAALFDLKSVRAQFQKSGEGVAPIPASWHYNRFDILDVKLEREQYVDGVWTNLALLDVIPEQVSVRDRLSGTVERATRDEVVSMFGQDGMQEAILRPEFYDTVNQSWTLPDPRVESIIVDEAATEEQKDIGRLEAAVRRHTADRDRKYDQLQDMGGSMGRDDGKEEEEEERKSPPGGAGSGAPPGGGSGMTGGGGTDRRKGGKKRGAAGSGVGMTGGTGMTGPAGGGRDNTQAIETLKKRIRALNKKIAAHERELAALRGDDGKVEEVVQDEDNMDEVLIFAHDINVESGATYRYRFTVELYNPFYAKKPNLLDEQQHLADSITISSAASEWSEPRDVIPDRKVYITKAFGPDSRQPGQVGMGQATAEVFRFAHGRWWRDTFQVEPGSRIGSEKQLRNSGDDGPTTIDYGTDWFVLDIITDIDAERTASERGYGATVLLQRLRDETTVRGDPTAADSDADREWLRDAVDLADLSGDLASG